MTPTHTATLVTTDRMTGQQRASTIPVRVTATRIEDDMGRYYDRALSGACVGPARIVPACYVRRIVLDSLKPYARPRVRL